MTRQRTRRRRLMLLANIRRCARLSTILEGRAAARAAVGVDGAFGRARRPNGLVDADGVRTAERGSTAAVAASLETGARAELRSRANRNGIIEQRGAAAGLAISGNAAVVGARRCVRLHIVNAAGSVTARLFVVRTIGARAPAFRNDGCATSAAAGIGATADACRLAAVAGRGGAGHARVAAGRRLAATAAGLLSIVPTRAARQQKYYARQNRAFHNPPAQRTGFSASTVEAA